MLVSKLQSVAVDAAVKTKAWARRNGNSWGTWDWGVVEGKCPKGKECRGTLMICGKCVVADVGGNITFGVAMNMLGLSGTAAKNISDWALTGAHILTITPALIDKLLVNARTKETVVQFIEDAAKALATT